MDSPKKVYESLQNASHRFKALKQNFDEYTRLTQQHITDGNALVNGITLAVLKPDVIEIQFLERVFHLVFTVHIPTGKSHLVGIVRIYSVERYPEKEMIDCGGFEFLPDAKTNLINPDNDEAFYINWDQSAIDITLHLLREALSE